MQTDRTHSVLFREASQRRHVALLVTLVALYLGAFLVLRWLHVPLLEGHARDGWQPPSAATRAHLVLATLLPVVLWAVLVHALWRRLPGPLGASVLALALFPVLALMEMDVAWFRMSESHLGWRELSMLATEDLRDWGVPPEQQVHYAKRVAKHGAALAAFWLAAGVLARLPWPTLRLARGRMALALLLPICVVDTVAVGYRFSRDLAQWVLVSEANPVRATFLDRLAERIFRSRSADLEAAELALSAARASRGAPMPVSSGQPVAAPGTRARHSVLLITVEGLNPRYVDAESMPFLSELAARSLVAERHYATGNATEYGILGLLYGSPVDFVVPMRALPEVDSPAFAPERQAASPYLEAFEREGYGRRVVSRAILHWAGLSAYLHGFDRPPFEVPGVSGTLGADWGLVDALVEELAAKEPRLVVTHLVGTHHPYTHLPEYTRFEPEVPEGFDYFAFDLAQHREAIVNRYRNTLVELDAWLRTVIGRIDLSRTIVVVTGDHGEEFFETGRFTHANALSDPQLRTPLWIHAPGLAPRVVREVTSHADVMPTLMDLLGWADPGSGVGRSLLDPAPARVAIAAHSNRPRAPERWAVVTADAKSVVRMRRDGSLALEALFDAEDRPIEFRDDPARWRANLAAVASFERRLAGSWRGRTPDAAGSPVPSARAEFGGCGDPRRRTPATPSRMRHSPLRAAM